MTTWNVLHRVHAVNWKEAPVLTFPDERVRIAGITKMVAEWLDDGILAVCLQEVSGDQLASLRQELGARAALLFDHLYPRMPRVRGGGGPVLGDASEHLVTIVANAPAQRVASQTFDSDPGKGMLIVDLDDVRLIDTHVSFGERGVNQVAAIAEAASEASKRGAIVVGDFNAPADALRASFGDSFRLSNLTGQRATRSATESDRGHAIDHVAVCGGAIESATVLESRGLSDHAPVTALVRFDGS